MSQPKLFNINLFERNILISQIQGLEKDQVYSSIPAFIFQNRGWVIKGSNELIMRLNEFGEKDVYNLANNPLAFSYLTVTLKNPEQTAVIIPNEITMINEALISGLSKRSPSAQRVTTPPLPISDDEDELNGKSNPTLQCFDRAYRVLRTYLIYFTETFIISSQR
jgi:hypothetical protein